VGSVNRACSYAEVEVIFEGEITDDFSFAFISPEGTNNNGARHTNSPLKGLIVDYLKLLAFLLSLETRIHENALGESGDKSFDKCFSQVALN
jgi:hypothetical protein